MGSLVKEFRQCFVYAGLFSLAINVLLLAPPLYMLQVFDRVLASRSVETLLEAARRTALERYDLRRVCLPAQVRLVQRLAAVRSDTLRPPRRTDSTCAL